MIAVNVIAFLIDLGRVGVQLPRVERGRRRLGPLPLLGSTRAMGCTAPRRSAAGRARLIRAIAWVDACCPGGGNCYRRALLEVSLDPEAAKRALAIGIKLHDSSTSGHAWVSIGRDPHEHYDLVLKC